MQLSERAVLTSLHIGMWAGEVLDRKITDEVATTHNAEKDAGRYTKRLFSRKAQHGIVVCLNEARRAHRAMTLPWGDDGTRILSAAGFMLHSESMRDARIRFEEAVEAFLRDYPNEHMAEAKVRLKKMFDANDYPPLEKARNRFNFDVEITPVPERGDLRVKLSNEQVKSITKDIEQRTQQRLDAAMQDVFIRIRDVAERMAERLRAFKPHPGMGRPEGIFKDSLVGNIKELAELLPSLNLTEDQRIEDLRQRLINELTAFDPKELREDIVIREQTARNAEDILAKVRGFIA